MPEMREERLTDVLPRVAEHVRRVSPPAMRTQRGQDAQGRARRRWVHIPAPRARSHHPARIRKAARHHRPHP
ncbi:MULTISPECIES: hypothetical protein [unclassified Agrococcus]|uniref:hypothetical protein n=1 Tax=unclassified Agrococcus TaxID=2615065 RepID=UPI00361884A3